jgi:hypothetical protein
VGLLVSTEGNPLHIGREERAKVSTGRFLKLPRPMSPAVRIKVRPVKAGIKALLHLRNNHRGKDLASLIARVLVRRYQALFPSC